MTTLTIPFDTYKLVSRFIELGFSKSQSEALVETVHTLDTAITRTTREVDDIKTDLKVLRTDVADIKAQLVEITKHQMQLPYWIAGSILAACGLVVAILQLLRA